MALSVSGFPEPLRQLSGGETDIEPSLLSNNPRLRGLFGKKTESKSSGSTTPPFRQYTEDSMPPSPTSSTPRSSQMLPPPSDEQVFLAQMALQHPQPLPPIPVPSQQRQRQISLTRRTPPPPVKRQPSLGRLEIGSAPRSTAVHALPKPPTVVVQEWSMSMSAKNTDPNLAMLPRPLPAVPNPGPIVESSKSAALRLNNNNSNNSAASGYGRPPASKVLMSSPSRPRAQTTSPPAVSVRYQALVVETTESPSGPSSGSSSATTSTSTPTPTTNAPSVRPLPRIPPASAVNPSPHAQLPRHVPRPARVKRPKTSDAVPSSWASRPVDLNPSQPVASGSGTHHHHHNQPVPPLSAVTATAPRVHTSRHRSHSRSRRDHSADTRTPTSPVRRSSSRTPTVTPPPSRRGSAWATGYTVHQQLQQMQPSTSSPRGKRGSSAALCSPPSKIEEESASIRTVDSASIKDGYGLHSHPIGRLSNDVPAPTTTSTTTAASLTPEMLLPVEVFIDDEDYSSVLSRSPSPMRYARPSSRGSLNSTTSTSSRSRSRSRKQLRAYRNSYRGPPSPSRSPSPILYARRNSLVGVGVEVEEGEAEGEGEGEAKKRHRHTQPRSYQFDYKAAQDSSPFITGGGSGGSSGKEGKEGKGGGSVSSGVERPSRSRSPRRSRFGTPNGSVIDISLSSARSSNLSSREDGGGSGKAGRLRTSSTTSEAGMRGLRKDKRNSINTNKSNTNSISNPRRNSARVVGAWRDLAPRRKGVDERHSQHQQKEEWISMGQVYNYKDENAMIQPELEPVVWRGEGDAVDEDVAGVIPRLKSLRMG